jgi:hypothetical protein
MAGCGGGVRNAAKTPSLVAAFLLVVLTTASAEAYDAKVNWRAVAGAKSYRMYVRYNDDAYALVGEKPATVAAGTLLSNTIDVALAMTTSFAVTSVGDGGSESGKSNAVVVAYALAARVADTDGDGLTNAQEDIDLDGVVDAGETNPRDADTDHDGLSDSQELSVYATNPLRADTDGDGTSDGREVAAGTGPRDASTSPNVFVTAADRYASFSGAMKTGTQYAAGADLDPAANSLGVRLVYAGSMANALVAGSGDKVSYRVKLPKAGQWFAWGRFYYPGAPGSNDANSFWLRVDAHSALKFGNDTRFRKWHWDGDGESDSNGSVALALGYLTAGTHVVTVEKREVNPIPPRLDVLLLTLDGKTVPKDADAVAWIARNPAGAGVQR